MPNPLRSHLLCASAALAAAVLLASAKPAAAQYRIDTGHDNDANNRIGSGGYNSNRDWTTPSMGANGTQLLTGNVTGLYGFQGNSQVWDPNVVQTNTGTTASDTLNAEAAPVNYGQRSTGQPIAQPFYSTAIVTNAPPPGSVITTSNNTGYLPAGPMVQLPNDTRLGTISTVPNASLNPTPGELDLPGPVDISGNPMMTTMSPLYGMRDWRVSDPNDMYFLSRYSNVNPMGGSGGGLDAGSIQRMRNELNATVVQGSALSQQNQSMNPASPNNGNTASPNTPGGANPNSATGSNPAPGGQVNLAQTQQLDRPMGSPSNGSLGQQSLTSALTSPSLSSSLTTDQGQRQQMLNVQLPSPGQQSSQLATLEDRERALQSQSKQPMSDEEADRIYNEQHEVRQRIDQQNKPGAGATGASAPDVYAAAPPTAAGASPPSMGAAAPPPGKTLNPMLTSPKPAALAAGAMEPYVITSLATGIRSPGLADMLRNAENQMRDGQFNKALDTYDSAQQVAPNNPFIRLGRGFAELGSSYYGRAEQDIRNAINMEPALLAARYDLKGFLGEDRLNFVTRDLQSINKSEPNSEQAPFLLAFLSHNAAQDDQAAAYLNDAQKRAGSNDPVIPEMRRNWGLPAATH